jgi:hypothetical protein
MSRWGASIAVGSVAAKAGRGKILRTGATDESEITQRVGTADAEMQTGKETPETERQRDREGGREGHMTYE